MNNGRIVERGSYKDINDRDSSSVGMNDSQYTNFRDLFFDSSSSLDSLSIQDVRLKFSRIERLSSLNHERRKDTLTKGSMKAAEVTSSIKLRKENREFIENTFYDTTKPRELKKQVSLRDWCRMFSFGIGNFYFLLSLTLG